MICREVMRLYSIGLPCGVYSALGRFGLVFYNTLENNSREREHSTSTNQVLPSKNERKKDTGVQAIQEKLLQYVHNGVPVKVRVNTVHFFIFYTSSDFLYTWYSLVKSSSI
jgi:hypothetical protein